MKQFIHPKYLQLFYRHEETDEIKFVKIKWKDVVTFKIKNITQSIRTKDNMLIKMDIINQLELIAKNVIYDNESKTELPLYKILPFEYRLYEITIVDKQNQHHTYGITNDYKSYESTRNFDDFKISYN